jgi:hypothetical protein
MTAKYVISRRDGGKPAAWMIEAVDEAGGRELLGLFLYRKGARRVGAELSLLAPVEDTTADAGEAVRTALRAEEWEFRVWAGLSRPDAR